MKFQKRSGLTGRDIGLLALIGLFGLTSAGILLTVNLRVGRQVPGGGDFFAPWMAARGFLFNRTEPYSGEVAGAVQHLVYGRDAQPGESPFIPTVPFPFLPVFYPVAFISNPVLARAVWMVISEGALILTALISLRLVEMRARPVLTGALILYSFLGCFAAIGLLSGSPAILLSLLYCASLSFLLLRQDMLAGVLLVFALYHLETGLLFIVFILWRVFSERRREVLAGSGMTLAALLLVSYLTYPGWMIPFFRAVLANLRAEYGLALGQTLTHLWPAHGLQLAWIISVLSILLLGFEWAAFRPEPRRYVWVACLMLTATVFLGIKLEMGDLVFLLPAWLLILTSVVNRWRAGTWIALGLGVATLAIPWYLIARSNLLGEPHSAEASFLFYPLVTAIGLYWSRWWFLRSPRTWLDTVRTNQGG